MSTVQRWFPYRRDDGDAEVFAFPHAGGASTVFNGLREALRQEGLALSAAVLPGHGRRLREPPHRRMDALLAELDAIGRADGWAAFQGDYAILGHCSGALIAYEMAKVLVRAPCRNPQLLVVCSCLPPEMIFDTGMSSLPTAELIEQTGSMGGTPAALLTDPDFLEILERPLRADWEIYDRYVRPPSPPLPVPILAVRGTEDPNVSSAFLARWQEQTSTAFRCVELESGHWAVDSEATEPLAKEIGSALRAAGTGDTFPCSWDVRSPRPRT